jgi:hypothetical protein
VSEERGGEGRKGRGEKRTTSDSSSTEVFLLSIGPANLLNSLYHIQFSSHKLEITIGFLLQISPLVISVS